ncbi:hypothetical protein SAMN05192544_1001529 [Paraburkholderia hospita]|jgi:hypothetical protein|uniref:Uncharacterized protein n=1 Tax=Paraburkholderia hospita TaxID=169430 RepID=A0AAJ4SRK6_9BURK|nr:hypothetical protein C2L64_01935 [Paraburkholderia hospita]EUC16671.1 hypothetical protein PMI06_004702 [Burkholderia sp. BT03]OUL91773.1 hypothetical protein CA603_15350 [Paraburkholderia hospita]SEH43662.1 hypothetical protein SAMN05192544_1001529 [Paraburkholderia hospita]SKC96028.1 hypothetical protein SAMN06266956_7122 [Paraburkholderia hospita]
MHRFLGTFGFAFIGLLSVFAWSSIDTRLCDAYARLCIPRAGECGGGLDTCPITTQVFAEFALYLLAPPVLFAGLGYLLCARRSNFPLVAKCIAIAIVVHWLSTFVAMRVFHI